MKHLLSIICSCLLTTAALFFSVFSFGSEKTTYYLLLENRLDDSCLKCKYQERLEAWMRYSYKSKNSAFAGAFRKEENFRYTSELNFDNIDIFGEKVKNLIIGESVEYGSDPIPEEEKLLVVLVDAYGVQNFSKVVITDVDMDQSILIAKDIFEKFPQGVYTVVASSANDLVSQKLIIQ